MKRGIGPPLQITQWIEKSISGLQLQSEIRDWKRQSTDCIVDTVMSGNFKASPARFEYFIALTGDKICKLRVEFQGTVR
jgi:hypothetical protein